MNPESGVLDEQKRHPTILHPILVVIADWWALGVGIGLVLAVGTQVTGKPLPMLMAVVTLPVSLFTPIIYLAVFSRRTAWLSYGERLIGRMATPTGKLWTNPFGRNRWALILVWFVTLTLEGNRWDEVYERTYPVKSIILGAILMVFVFVSVLRWAEGRTSGAWCVVAYQVFVAVSMVFQAQFGATGPMAAVPKEILHITASLAGGLAVISFILMLVYRSEERSKQPNQSAGGDA